MMHILLTGLLLAQSPSNESPLLDDAELATTFGDHNAAALKYRLYLEQNPNSYVARMGLARSLSMAGRQPEAVVVYNDILRMNPEDVDSRLGLARAYAWAGYYQDAEDQTRLILERHPERPDAWQTLGDIYTWWGKPADAASAYTQWARLEPNNPQPYQARAAAHRQQQRWILAKEDLLRARGVTYGSLDRETIDTNIHALEREKIRELPWELDIVYSNMFWNEIRSTWHTLNVFLKRDVTWGTWALETIWANRFDQNDFALGGHIWYDLWEGSYIHTRAMVGTMQRVLPTVDLFAEWFQVLDDWTEKIHKDEKGWEASLRYRLMSFPTDTIHFYGGGLKKTHDKLSLRGRIEMVMAEETDGIIHTLQLRYQFAEDDFVELIGGFGEQELVIGDGPILQNRDNYFYGARVETFLTKSAGIIGGVNFFSEDGGPDGWGITAGYQVRW